MASLTPQSPTAVSTERLEDELSRDDAKRRAVNMLEQKGWAAGSKFSLHSMLELLSEMALDVQSKPLDQCSYPTCGCDADAVCAVALRSPLQDSQELVERLTNSKHMLHAMAMNYAGGHLVDHLDIEVFNKAEARIADAITALSTPSPRIVQLEARIAELETAELARPSFSNPEEGVHEIIADYRELINSTPELTSLLYDIDMLPEQCVTRAGAIRLAGLCEVWKLKVAAESALSTAEARALERAANIADRFSCGACGMDGKVSEAIRSEARALSTNEAGE